MDIQKDTNNIKNFDSSTNKDFSKAIYDMEI